MARYARLQESGIFHGRHNKIPLFYTIKSQLVRLLLLSAAVLSSYSIFVKVAFVKLEK